MDGTVVNSLAVTTRIWTEWAHERGVDPAALLPVVHGVQAVDTIRRFAPPGVDVEREAAELSRREIAAVEGIVEVPGAGRLLASLPADRWAIVTSAPRALALGRLGAARLPIPRVLIGAEDAPHGKPAPDPYLAAAQALGVPIGECLVWEDAPAGIASAEAAGAAVMVITATHPEPPPSVHPHRRDFVGLQVAVLPDGRLRLEPPGSD